MAILVFDKQIDRYGFSIKSRDAKEIREFLICNEIGLFRWKPIQMAYVENPENVDIRWLRGFEFNNLTSIQSRMLRLFRKLNRKIRGN